MDRDEARQMLDDLAAAMHEQFADEQQAARLAQLDAHLATVRMTVDHLYDEADRLAPRQ